MTSSSPRPITLLFGLLAGLFLFSSSVYAQTLTVTGGQGQLMAPVTIASQALAVQLLDSTGKPYPSQLVTFTIVNQPFGYSVGTLLNSVSVTDTNGMATASFIGAPVPPFNLSYVTAQVTATYGAASAQFYETTSSTVQGGGLAVSAQLLSPPAGTILAGQAGSTSATPVQVLVSSLFTPGVAGSGVPYVAISLTTDSGSTGSISCKEGPFVLTDTTGTATCTPLFGTVGSGTFTISVGGLVSYFNNQFQVSVGPPAMIQITSGNNQSGAPGAQLPLPLVGVVTDLGGNPTPGVAMTFTSVTPGGATFTNVRPMTDANGRVSANAILGSVPGAIQISLTDTGGLIKTPAIFTETVNLTITGLMKVSGDPQTAFINSAFSLPLVVQVNASTAASGVPVSFAVTSGSATVGTPNATTDSMGKASTTVTAGSVAGPVIITARSGSYSVTFNLTVAPPGPSNLTLTNGASGVTNSLSPGSIVTIYGNGIASNVQGAVGNTIAGPLPYQVAGVGVLFGTTPAPIYDVANLNGTQSVTVEVPYELPPGPVAVTVAIAGGGSGTVQATVLAASPGLFQYTAANGQPYVVAIKSNGSVAGPSNPATRGENVTIYVTGLGPLSPAIATNSFAAAGSTPTPVYSLILGVANQGATYNTAASAPDLIGVQTINFPVPTSVNPGPVTIAIGVQTPSGAVIYSQGSTLNVQ